MADKVLGIDIGDDAVKAVLVSRSFKGGYRIAASARISIAQAGSVADAIRMLFDNVSFRGFSVVTALSAQDLYFRNISLPFRDEKKIRQILSFEVEPLLHFPVHEAIIDYVMVHKGDPSDLFVAIAPKTTVQERAAHISRYVKRVAKMDVEGAAIYALLSVKYPVDGCTLLLDVGAEHSTGLVVQDGRLCQIRPFAFGGNHITRTIAAKLGVDIEEAEHIKRENRHDKAQEDIAKVIAKVLSEMDNTIEFMKMHGRLHEGPRRICLTGGGALYAPFQEALSRHFAAPAGTIDILTDGDVHFDQVVPSDCSPVIMNQALALAVAGHKKIAGFNFRTGDSEVRTAIGRLRGTLHWAAAVTGLVIILAGADAYLDYRYNRQRIDALKAEIMTLFKTYNPHSTRIVDPVSQMKGIIMDARKVSLGIVETRPDMTALALLKDVSDMAQPATELLLSSFVFEKDMVLLKGQVKNFDAVDILKKAFMKSKFFENVVIGGTTLTSQGDKVEFEMRATLKK